MYRDIFTNRWVLGGVGFLIVLAVACVLWYQHDIADERKAAADAEQLLRQSELFQESEMSSVVGQATDITPAESTTPTAKKSVTEKTPVTKDTAPTQAQNETESPAETAETAEVRVSPNGFGPYPEVPEDYPLTVEWERNPDTPDITHELLSRVFVKLWTEGEKNFYGGSTHKGKIYPHYNDAVYVNWDEYRDANGKMVRRIGHIKSGTRVKFTRADLYNPPPDLRVLDLESSGIDPYQYLNLPYKKRGKNNVQ